MISFPAISNINTNFSTRTQVQQNQVVAEKQVLTSAFKSYNQTNSLFAMKSQVAASDINFNQSFYSNIQYLNAQASVGIMKQVDGKISVAEDVFQFSKNEKMTVSDLQRRLNDIDNLAKDRNGSQSLLYTKSESSDKRNEKSDYQGSKLQNIYA